MYQSLKKTQNCLEKTYYEYLCLKFINNLWDNWVIIVTEDELILHSVYLLCFHSLLLFLVFVHVLVHVIVRKSLWCVQHEVKCSSQLWSKCLNSNFDGAHFQEQSRAQILKRKTRTRVFSKSLLLLQERNSIHKLIIKRESGIIFILYSKIRLLNLHSSSFFFFFSNWKNYFSLYLQRHYTNYDLLKIQNILNFNELWKIVG